MKVQTTLWKTQIYITQTPQPAPQFNGVDDQNLDYQETEKFRSFLNSLFGPDKNLTYGLEIRNSEKIDFIFSTIVNSESEAIEIGFTWLTLLKTSFVGLDGSIEIKRLSSNPSEGWTNHDISELVLPDGHLRYKVKIIELFISLFFLKKEYSIKLFFYWKRKIESNGNF
ncbi:MAG: hypothetical protein ACFE96_02555 [Candidatus Hermodarchaeota archaeon]